MKIYGETVKVSLRVFGAVDDYGNDTEEYGEPFEVENVLIGKGDTVNLIENGEPYAIRADIRFCFPRDWQHDLRGALIERMGKTYQIIGDPAPITDANIPPGIDWNIRADGVLYG